MCTNIYQFENISLFYTLSSVPPVQETLQVSPSHVCMITELHSPLHFRLPEQDNVQTFLVTPPTMVSLAEVPSELLPPGQVTVEHPPQRPPLLGVGVEREVDVLVVDVLLVVVDLVVDDSDPDTGFSVPPVQVSVHSPLVQSGFADVHFPLHKAFPSQLTSHPSGDELTKGTKEEN